LSVESEKFGLEFVQLANAIRLILEQDGEKINLLFPFSAYKCERGKDSHIYHTLSGASIYMALTPLSVLLFRDIFFFSGQTGLSFLIIINLTMDNKEEKTVLYIFPNNFDGISDICCHILTSNVVFCKMEPL